MVTGQKMFTGIIEATGRVERIQKGKRSTELVVRPVGIGGRVKLGSSVAVNGACLTVVAMRRNLLTFDVLEETLRRTNLDSVRSGDLVNLEWPVRAGAGIEGHFVLGHVDGRARVRRFEKDSQDYVLEIQAPRSLMKYVVEKGSIAVDGISLTVAGVGRDWFRVWIIPHTRSVTNLRARRVGDRVNLEVDILGKHVERLLRGSRRSRR